MKLSFDMMKALTGNPEQLLKTMVDKALTKPIMRKIKDEDTGTVFDMVIYRAKLKPEDPDYFYCVGIKPCPK